MKHDHIGNLLAAQAMVEAMPEGAFVLHLRAWANEAMKSYGPHACGSAGCFGGWVAQMPFFQAQGIRPCDCGCGMPTYHSDRWSDPDKVLFGDATLFEAEMDHETGTEKEIILARIRKALESAIVKA